MMTIVNSKAGNMDELIKNPILLIAIGGVITWSLNKLLSFMSNPAQKQLELLTKDIQHKNEVLEIALANNTQAMQSIAAIVHDHEARVQVLEDFKGRHDGKEDK